MTKKWIAVYMFRLGITDETKKIVEDYLQIVPHVKTDVWVFNDDLKKTASASCIVMSYEKDQPTIQYINKVLCLIPFPQPCFRSIFYHRETKDNHYFFEFSLSGTVVVLTKEEYDYLFN